MIWSFTQARQACPNAKLLLNEYGIINDYNALQQYRTIAQLLQSRGLIDGIGLQSHTFNIDNLAPSVIQTNLDALASTGLDLYISELDISGDDAQQLARYQDKFAVLYEHPAVKGVTLWGYQQGATWRDNTYLLRSDGTERPALTYLRDYFAGEAPPPATGTHQLTVRARGTTGAELIQLQVGNTLVASWTLSTQWQDYQVSTDATGGILVSYVNDNESGGDVQIDYLIADGQQWQAEDQSYNTGAWDGECGAGSFSEWLQCNGAIGFNPITDD